MTHESKLKSQKCEAKVKRPIKYVKHVWHYVNEDGSLEPVWSDEDEDKRTTNSR